MNIAKLFITPPMGRYGELAERRRQEIQDAAKAVDLAVKTGDVELIRSALLAQRAIHRKYSEDQPRDESGRWTDTGGGGGGSEEPSVTTGTGTEDDPIRTNDVNIAAQALAEGKHVELDQPRTVSTLLNKLSDVAEEAHRLGKDAPNYDLCDVTVEGTNLFCVGNLGISRVEMPQLTGFPTPGSIADTFPKNEFGEVNLSQNFAEHLATLGVAVTPEDVDPAYLRASQNELNGVKTAEIMDSILEKGYTTDNPIWVSRDDYVIDGHHRWAALVGAEYQGGPMEVPGLRVDMSITEILAEANDWTAMMGLQQRGFGTTLGEG